MERPFDNHPALPDESIQKWGWAPAKGWVQAMTESMRAPTRKPWNTRSLAISGAFFGTIAGTVQVMSEAFRPGFDGSEPFHQCFLEIVAVTVAGALLFAAAAWIRNRMFRA